MLGLKCFSKESMCSGPYALSSTSVLNMILWIHKGSTNERDGKVQASCIQREAKAVWIQADKAEFVQGRIPLKFALDAQEAVPRIISCKKAL